MTAVTKENSTKLKKVKAIKRPLEDSTESGLPKKVKKMKRTPAPDTLKNKKRLAKKKKVQEPEEPAVSRLPLVRHSDDPPPEPKVKWVNKQRVLVLCSHGIGHLNLDLMKNFRILLPHSKSEPKMEKKDPIYEITGICEARNCNKCLYFEQRRHDLYLWVSNVPNGPSAKFLVENVKSMDDLFMTGNCLRGGQRFVGFNKEFETRKPLQVLKELFTQTFQTPRGHPKSKPFLDHIFVFNAEKGDRICFRNYQIVDGGKSLEEIGPRMTLTLIKIFDGSFGGKTLYANYKYVTPSVMRRGKRLQQLQQHQEEEESSSEEE